MPIQLNDYFSSRIPGAVILGSGDLEAGIEAGAITIDSNAEVGALYGMVNVGSATPGAPVKDGDLWSQTAIPTAVAPGNLLGQPSHQLKAYWNGEWSGIPTSYSDTEPDGPADDGRVWVDLKLGLVRVHGTLETITGWHPLDAGAELWINQTSGDRVRGDAVAMQDPTVLANGVQRMFVQPTEDGQEDVAGILLEDILDGENGVIARPGSGMVVRVNRLAPGPGISVPNTGDGIRLGTSGYEVQSVDTLFDEGSADFKDVGIPKGCFGEIVIADPDELAERMARLIPVGEGRTRRWTTANVIAQIGDLASTNSDPFTDDEFDGVAVNTIDMFDLPGARVITGLPEAPHRQYVVDMDFRWDSGSSETTTFFFDSGAVPQDFVVGMTGRSGASNEAEQIWPMVGIDPQPVDTTSQGFLWRGERTGGGGSVKMLQTLLYGGPSLVLRELKY